MHLINHPAKYKDGTRVLFLKGRHKDGIGDQRMVMRVSHSPGEFDMWLNALADISHENERIYVSAGERDLKKAIRIFKERQLANDYDPKPELFYKKLNTRWCSCLMQTQCQLEKVWLFDCDSDDDAAAVEADLAEHYTNPITPYRYPSKSGHHIVVGPFNKTKLNPSVKALLHDNALMLWGY